jgi:uncharacterized membrane protein
MTDALNVLMRWLHIASMATLVGGVLYGRLIAWHAMQSLAPETRDQLSEALAARYRPFAFTAMALLLISGLYRFLTAPGSGPIYHAIFGLKMLLVLHVFAVGILMLKPHNPRRARLMTGTLISGLVIVLLSAVLHQIH